MDVSQAEDRIETEELKRYLEKRSGAPVRLRQVRELRGEAKGTAALKQFGYGRPLLVHYRVDEREAREVIHRIRRNAFGRERDDNHAAAVWLDFHTFNRLPRHVPAVDMLVQSRDGERPPIFCDENHRKDPLNNSEVLRRCDRKSEA